MTEAEVRLVVSQTGEAVTDETGAVVGYISAPARFKVNRPYLAGGGFLIVERDEQTGEFVGLEFDALWDKRKSRYYPAGYSERAFSTESLDGAVQEVLAYLAVDPGVAGGSG